MCVSTHANVAPATEQLKTQLQRAHALQEHFYAQSAHFGRLLSAYHQQMQQYYRRKLVYHERMEQLYRGQWHDNESPSWLTMPNEALSNAISPPADALMSVVDDADTDVTDAQWEIIASLLPLGNGRGRPYADDRRTLNGILFVTTYHVGWSHMPTRYGSYVTCWRRYLRWQSKGIWPLVQQVLHLSAADSPQAMSANDALPPDMLASTVYTSK